MSRKITITFDNEASILVDVSNDAEGTPCATPGQLLTICVRVLAVLSILSSKTLGDAFYAACHISSLVAEAIQDARENQYVVNIRLNGDTSDNLN